MSDDLVEVLEDRPKDLEHRLATAMREIGRRIVERPDLVRALNVADRLRAGLVIADEAGAAELADLMVTIVDGERALDVGIREAMSIPRQMEVALKGVVYPARDRLDAAKKVGGEARVQYQVTIRQRAAQEEARLRAEAVVEAVPAAAEAEAAGDDVPPEPEVAPVEVPRTVAGGTGKMGTQVRIVAVGIEDFADVPREWLALVPQVAVANFQAAERASRLLERPLTRPAPGESIVWKGVRFESREFAVNRR